MRRAKKRGLSAGQLKIVALLFMTLDSIDILLGTEPFPYYHICSRFVGVLFGYLLVDGFFYTSSRPRFFARLAIAGVIMSVGNRVVAHFTGSETVLEHGMFITLAAGFGIIWIFQWAKDQDWLSFGIRAAVFTGGGVVAIIAMMYVEGGFYMIPMIIASYFCHGRKKWLICLIVIVLSGLIAVNSITYTPDDVIDWQMFFTVNCDWAMVSVIPFILLYGGRRGSRSGFAKWVFYAYYPLHIWIFTIAGTFLGTFFQIFLPL